MPNNKLESNEMNNLQKQLANDSFVNEGGSPIAKANLKQKEAPTLSNNTRVVYSGEANRESSLDDG